jgi:hypothetical protein
VTEKPLAQSLSIICLSCLNDSHWIRHGAVFDGTKKNGINLVIHQLNSFVAGRLQCFRSFLRNLCPHQTKSESTSASFDTVYTYWNFRSDLTLPNTDDVRTNRKDIAQ